MLASSFDPAGPAGTRRPAALRRTARFPIPLAPRSPFDRLPPESRAALVRPDTLNSPIVRRWLGLAPADPGPAAGNPGAPDRYEILAGWTAKGDQDLGNLGRAALNRSTEADRTGQLAGLTGAEWREVGGRFLAAEQEIEQSSNEQAHRHGGDEAAYNTGLSATAAKADAGLPGHTAPATANTVRQARAKYQQNRAAAAQASQGARHLAAFRESYRAFRREADRARDRAERARRTGHDRAAGRHEADAARFGTAARAVLNDARQAGFDPRHLTPADTPPPAAARSGSSQAGSGEAGPAGSRAPDRRAPDNGPIDDTGTVSEAAPRSGSRGNSGNAGSAGTGAEAPTGPAATPAAATAGAGGKDDPTRLPLKPPRAWIDRFRDRKLAGLDQRHGVRDPKALIAALAGLRAALKQAGNDAGAHGALIDAFDRQLHRLVANRAGRTVVRLFVRKPAFAADTAPVEAAVFRALTGSTPKAAAEQAWLKYRLGRIEAWQQARAEAARKHLAAQRKAATERFASRAAALKDPAGRRAAMDEGFAIARKLGAMPRQLDAWLKGLLVNPAPRWRGMRLTPYGGGEAWNLVYPDASETGPPRLAVAAAQQVNRLRREHPKLWARLPASVRQKAVAIGLVLSGPDFAGGPGGDAAAGDRAGAVVAAANRALIKATAARNWDDLTQSLRDGFDLLTDLAPVIGEIKEAVRAHNFLRQAEAAERAGDTDKAAELRRQAGISLLSILPWARAVKAGGRLVARLRRVSRKLGADADPIIAGLEKRLGRPATRQGKTDHHLFDGDFADSAYMPKLRKEIVNDDLWREHRNGTRGIVERGNNNAGALLDPAGTARIGEARLFKRDGKGFFKTPQGDEIRIDRTPKAGLKQKVDKKPHLEKDVIHEETKDGGKLITIIVRDNSADGVEIFNQTVYYNPYGVPEFKAIASFLLSPKLFEMSETTQKKWIRDEIQEMARNKASWPELKRMGASRRQIRRLARGLSIEKVLRHTMHHDYGLARFTLVDSQTHDYFAHIGGRKGWGNKTRKKRRVRRHGS